ncbi:retron Ec78 anti-phage system effector HNH endonuclease PtuB [Endozoicomonas acroporae]|uniref:retron Ec78 anti-phage system effector HNH endonuclease PtuB n=1 Tax=Endozoicomonas acroporae TaxID=1701104 RepID=UPI0013D60C36|nr:retron Ec78 anti-phage system effector HNH endonuclease PtuB [Endozoicomonas acroporae]
MHKLDRPQSPGCLSQYHYGRNQWRDLSNDDRQAIWSSLETMQGERCAYCECDLQQHGRHIEHFRQRSGHNYPQGTFQWANLFGSCNREESCGKHKDRYRGYNYQDLIKPDIDNPDDYLIFVPDGTIQIRQGLTAQQYQKASETLRVFNLNADNGPLRWMRNQAAAGYLKLAEELLELATELEQDEWLPLYHTELEQIKGLPFETAIRHALTPIDG